MTPPGIRLTSVEIRNVGSGFPFDQAQVVTLSGVLGDREATEIAFIDAVERYARAIEQAPGFIQRKIERTGEPEPIRPQGGYGRGEPAQGLSVSVSTGSPEVATNARPNRCQ
ncbi:MAG: hypothetical protein MPW15_30065 (plasmid) [Candidatus Manganitrophus sp.]|nr:hypothetical protein [Candidatus Manganitrophus sp.]